MLADFGNIDELYATGGVGEGIRGTPGFMAPEMELTESFGFSADTWSLGAILAEMLAGVSMGQLMEAAGHKLAGHNAVHLLSVLEEAGFAAMVPKAVQPVLDALLHPDGATRPVAADVLPLVEAALQRLRGQQ